MATHTNPPLGVMPGNLVCLTVQHIMDDPDAVEGLIREYNVDEIMRCMPLALKEVLNMPTVPDVRTLHDYLYEMWRPFTETEVLNARRILSERVYKSGAISGIYSDGTRLARYRSATKKGLVYLLPFINSDPDCAEVDHILGFAIYAQQLNVVDYIYTTYKKKCKLQFPLTRVAANDWNDMAAIMIKHNDDAKALAFLIDESTIHGHPTILKMVINRMRELNIHRTPLLDEYEKQFL